MTLSVGGVEKPESGERREGASISFRCRQLTSTIHRSLRRLSTGVSARPNTELNGTADGSDVEVDEGCCELLFAGLETSPSWKRTSSISQAPTFTGLQRRFLIYSSLNICRRPSLIDFGPEIAGETL